MRLTKFAVLLSIFAMILLLPVKMSLNEIHKISDLRNRYAIALEEAVDDAMREAVYYDTAEKVKVDVDLIEESFFKTLFINLGCPTDKILQNSVRNYIPVLLFAGEDGYRVNYMTLTRNANNELISNRAWSEVEPYTYVEGRRIFHFYLGENKKNFVSCYDGITNDYYEGTVKDLSSMSIFSVDDTAAMCQRSELLCDGHFDEVRRITIVNALLDGLKYYINQHNKISKQYRLGYKFTLPSIDKSDFERTIDDISLMAIFQGYPYSSVNKRLGFFNEYAIGGARLVKGHDVYVTYDIDSKRPMYHEKTCGRFKECEQYWKDNLSLYSTLFGKDYRDALHHPVKNKKEAAKKGAYPCTECDL